MDHHALQGLAGTLFAVPSTAPAPVDEVGLLQAPLDPGVGPLTAVLALVALVEVLDVPALVTPLVERLETDDLVDRGFAVRDLLDPPVDQTVQAGFLIAVDVTPERPLTDPQQPRRFLLREPPVLPARIGFFEPHHPYLL